MLRAVCENDIDSIEAALRDGFDVNETLDKAQKFNAASLACHLDKLEVLHCLDMHGANLSSGAGKFKLTPLMTAIMRWNVRMIDYLIERGVNPHEPDCYGFTAKKKAELKNLRAIHSMIANYESKYKNIVPETKGAITNKQWIEKLGNNKAQDYSRV
jgi:ankyrin repeat protein